MEDGNKPFMVTPKGAIGSVLLHYFPGLNITEAGKIADEALNYLDRAGWCLARKDEQ